MRWLEHFPRHSPSLFGILRGVKRFIPEPKSKWRINHVRLGEAIPHTRECCAANLSMIRCRDLSVGCRQCRIEEGQRYKEREKSRRVGDGAAGIRHVSCLYSIEPNVRLLKNSSCVLSRRWVELQFDFLPRQDLDLRQHRPSSGDFGSCGGFAQGGCSYWQRHPQSAHDQAFCSDSTEPRSCPSR